MRKRLLIALAVIVAWAAISTPGLIFVLSHQVEFGSGMYPYGVPSPQQQELLSDINPFILVSMVFLSWGLSALALLIAALPIIIIVVLVFVMLLVLSWIDSLWNAASLRRAEGRVNDLRP